MNRPIVLLAVLLCLTIAASAEAQSAQQAVALLEATPPRVVVMAGETVPLEIRALDGAGRVVDVPMRSIAPRAGAVVRNGTVLGVAAGEYEIIATVVLPPGSQGAPASLRVPLTVTWPNVDRLDIRAQDGRLYQGTTLRHWASASHTDGSVRPETAFQWTSSDPSVASVDRFGYVTGSRRWEKRYELRP